MHWNTSNKKRTIQGSSRILARAVKSLIETEVICKECFTVWHHQQRFVTEDSLKRWWNIWQCEVELLSIFEQKVILHTVHKATNRSDHNFNLKYTFFSFERLQWRETTCYFSFQPFFLFLITHAKMFILSFFHHATSHSVLPLVYPKTECLCPLLLLWCQKLIFRLTLWIKSPEKF